MKEVTVAVVQMDTKLGEPEVNLAKMSDFVRKITSEQKVDLIVFPSWPPPAMNAASGSRN